MDALLELARLLHDALGIESPREFIAVCACIGLVIGAGLGWLIDKGYQAKLVEQSKPATSVNTTTGPQSPVMPDNRGNVTITNEDDKTKHPPPKNKPK